MSTNRSDRPHFRVSADRQAASRRVRYVESNLANSGDCTLCRLEQEDPPSTQRTTMTADSDDNEEGFAEQTLLGAIENQLAAGEPAAVQATLNKLSLVGYEREEILQMMAQVLAAEIRQMLEQDTAFDLQHYEQALRALPELPDDPDQG